MANKVTKETLKMLIEGVLEEAKKTTPNKSTLDKLSFFNIPPNKDEPYISNFNAFKKELGGDPSLRPDDRDEANQYLNALAQIQNEKTSLDEKDIDYFIDIPEKEKTQRYKSFTTEMEGALQILKRLKDYKDDDFVKSVWGSETAIIKLSNKATKALEQYQEYEDKKSFQTSSIMDPLDVKKASQGFFGSDESAIIQKLFGSATTVPARITILNDISEKYLEVYKMSEANPKDPQIKTKLGTDTSKIIAEILLLDMFNVLLRDMDQTSASYNFEAFCALLAGGSQTGASKTSGNVMGASDFIDMNKNLGSSKYYRGSEGIEQSYAGIQEAGKPIHYIIAIKKQGLEQVGKSTKGSTLISDNIGLEIYQPIVGYDEKASDGDGDVFIIPGGGTDKIYGDTQTTSPSGLVYNGRVYIGNYIGKPSGTVFISSFRTETFKEYLNIVFKEDQTKAFDAYKKLENYLSNLETAKEMCTTYTVQPTGPNAVATDNALTNANNIFKDIQVIFQSPITAVTESKKITARSLKKIIEESFKKNK